MAKITDKVVFIDDSQYQRRAEAILRGVGNLRLVGETGTGKSTLVHFLCQVNGWELWEFQLSTDTSRWDLLAEGILTPEKDAQGKSTGATKSSIRLGTVCSWLLGPFEDEKAKQVLFLDEFNYAQPQVMTLLNSLADFRGSIHVPELVGSPISASNFDPDKGTLKRIKGKHLLVIGMNPAEKSQYVGTIGMNIAQLRRFESLEVRYMSSAAETQAVLAQVPEMNNPKDKQVLAKWISYADVTRKHYADGDLGTPITTGNIINYCKMYKDKTEGMSEFDILEIIESMYRADERQLLKNLMTK